MRPSPRPPTYLAGFSMSQALVRLVSPQDHSDVSSDLLKHSFTALAFLFKFLRKQLVDDLDNFFTLFHPLLGPGHRDFVRQFAAEAYGFLMRKIPAKMMAGHLAHIWHCLSESPSPEVSRAWAGNC